MLIFYLASIFTLRFIPGSTTSILRHCIHQKLAMNNEELLDRMCCGECQQPSEEPPLSQEFHRALAHQTFGIDEYNVTERGGTAVRATLKLSDGRICAVELSKQGYEVLSLELPAGERHQLDSSQFPVFESLDNLLRAVSPSFKATWEKLLLERLNEIQNAQ